MKKTTIIILTLATIAGLVIAWIDSRPNWDDTGITVFMVFCASTLLGYLSPQKTWLIALAVSIWIPLYGILLSNNFGSLIALNPRLYRSLFGAISEKKYQWMKRRTEITKSVNLRNVSVKGGIIY